MIDDRFTKLLIISFINLYLYIAPYPALSCEDKRKEYKVSLFSRKCEQRERLESTTITTSWKLVSWRATTNLKIKEGKEIQ